MSMIPAWILASAVTVGGLIGTGCLTKHLLKNKNANEPAVDSPEKSAKFSLNPKIVAPSSGMIQLPTSAVIANIEMTMQEVVALAMQEVVKVENSLVLCDLKYKDLDTKYLKVVAEEARCLKENYEACLAVHTISSEITKARAVHKSLSDLVQNGTATTAEALELTKVKSELDAFLKASDFAKQCQLGCEAELATAAEVKLRTFYELCNAEIELFDAKEALENAKYQLGEIKGPAYAYTKQTYPFPANAKNYLSLQQGASPSTTHGQVTLAGSTPSASTNRQSILALQEIKRAEDSLDRCHLKFDDLYDKYLKAVKGIKGFRFPPPPHKAFDELKRLKETHLKLSDLVKSGTASAADVLKLSEVMSKLPQAQKLVDLEYQKQLKREAEKKAADTAKDQASKELWELELTIYTANEIVNYARYQLSVANGAASTYVRQIFKLSDNTQSYLTLQHASSANAATVGKPRQPSVQLQHLEKTQIALIAAKKNTQDAGIFMEQFFSQ